MSSVIKLERLLFTRLGTFGVLRFPTGESFSTVERPWLNNRRGESCIPEGDYPLVMRSSPVVNRITAGRYPEGWEVTEVEDRDYIMFHPGNWPHDFKGCIGVGKGMALLTPRNGEKQLAVRDSQEAFDEFMALMEQGNNWYLQVSTVVADAPQPEEAPAPLELDQALELPEPAYAPPGSQGDAVTYGNEPVL